MVGVALAFLGARRAALPARRDLGPRELGDVLRLPGENVAGGIADVRAVQAEPDAPAEVGHLLLGQIRVGAGDTAPGAGKALVDAAGQSIAVELSRIRMCLQHVLGQGCGGHGSPFAVAAAEPTVLPPAQQTSGRSTDSCTVEPGRTVLSAGGEDRPPRLDGTAVGRTPGRLLSRR